MLHQQFQIRIVRIQDLLVVSADIPRQLAPASGESPIRSADAPETSANRPHKLPREIPPARVLPADRSARHAARCELKTTSSPTPAIRTSPTQARRSVRFFERKIERHHRSRKRQPDRSRHRGQDRDRHRRQQNHDSSRHARFPAGRHAEPAVPACSTTRRWPPPAGTVRAPGRRETPGFHRE